MSFEVLINDTTVSLPESATVNDGLKAMGFDCEEVAVACNGDFVPRSEWSLQPLRAGDRLDVVAPVQGG